MACFVRPDAASFELLCEAAWTELQTWKRGKKGTLIGPEKRDLRETWLLDLARHTSAGLYAGFLLVLGSVERRDDATRTEANVSRAELEPGG